MTHITHTMKPPFYKASFLLYNFCLLLFTHNLKAGINEIPYIDSIRHSATYTLIEKTDVNQMEDSARYFAYKEVEKSIAYSIKILDLGGKKLNDIQLNAYYNLASQTYFLYGLKIAPVIIEQMKSINQDINSTLLAGHIALIESLFFQYHQEKLLSLQKAEEAVENYKKSFHPNIIRAYGVIALIQEEMGFYEKSLENYKIVFSYYEKYPDYEERIRHITNFVPAFIVQTQFQKNPENYHLAKKLNQEAIELYFSNDYREYFSISVAHKYFLAKMSGKGIIEAGNLLEETISKLNNKSMFYAYGYLHEALADYYVNYTEDYNRALQSGLVALKLALAPGNHNHLVNQYDTQKVLAKIYYKMNDLDNLFKTHNKVDSLQDAFHENENKNILAKMAILMNVKDIELENEKATKHILLQRFLLIGGLIVVGSLFFILKKRNKFLKSLQENESNLKLAYQNLFDNKSIIEQQQLSLDQKNQQLTAELKSNLTLLSNYIDNNNSVIELIKSDQQIHPKNQVKLIKILKNTNNKEIIDEINFKFNNMYPDFYQKLTSGYPDLTPNNIKICILVRMNLSIKEIASLTYKTPGTIKVAKARIKKKLGFTNSAKTLYHILNTI